MTVAAAEGLEMTDHSLNDLFGCWLLARFLVSLPQATTAPFSFPVTHAHPPQSFPVVVAPSPVCSLTPRTRPQPGAQHAPLLSRPLAPRGLAPWPSGCHRRRGRCRSRCRRAAGRPNFPARRRGLRADGRHAVCFCSAERWPCKILVSEHLHGCHEPVGPGAPHS